MVRIGIELNGVLRNVNYQMCKYYAKDIDPLFTFDKKDIDNLNMKDTLKFNSKKEFNEFVYVNYPLGRLTKFTSFDFTDIRSSQTNSSL